MPSPKPINQALVYNAIQLRNEAKTQTEIAIELGVTQGTVSRILRAHGLGGKRTGQAKLRKLK